MAETAVKLNTSKDGKCRAAEVIVISNGKQLRLERPINDLYLVEASVSD